MNERIAAVLLPTRGFSASLVQCIESIKADRNSNFLRIYLLVNGKYSDISQIVKLLRSSDLLIDATNISGLGNVLNLGLENVKEDHIFRMDDDDLWNNTRYKSQMHYLNTGYDLVIGQAKFKNRFGLPIPCGRLSGKGYFHPETLLLGNHIIHPSVAFSKKFIERHKYRNSFAEDFDLWLRAFREEIKWAHSSQAITYTTRKTSLTNEPVPPERMITTVSSYNHFSEYYGIDFISVDDFLLLTGQSSMSSHVSRKAEATLIDILEKIALLEFFQTPIGLKLFNDHLVTVIARNTSLASKLFTKFGVRSDHVRSISRRVLRRPLIW